MTSKTSTKTKAPEIELPILLEGSSMASLHKSKPLRDALLTIPEWVEAAQALTYLDSVRPPRRRWGTLEEEMTAYVEGLIERREPFDAEAAEAHAIKAHAKVAALQSTEAAFTIAARGYVERLDSAALNNADAIYRHLSEQMQALVDEARANVGGFDLTADSAISAGRIDAWQEARALHSRHHALRSAITSARQRLGWDVIAGHAYPELDYVANPTDLFRHWRAWRVDGHLVDDHGNRKTLRSPWPDHREVRGTELEFGWLEYLARTPEAEAWVPTQKQYDEASAALSEYARGIRPMPTLRRHTQEPPPPTVWREDNSQLKRRGRVA